MNDRIDIAPFLETMGALLAKTLCIKNMNIPITLETKLVNGVGTNDIDLNSIDYVDFLVCIENEFDIIFDFEAKILTIGDIYQYINEYKAKVSN